MFWMFMTVLWVVMLLAPLVLLVALLPCGRDCPRCGGETVLMRYRLLSATRRFLGRRWCLACGWEGMMRFSARHQPPALVVAEPVPDEVDDDAVWRGERDGTVF